MKKFDIPSYYRSSIIGKIKEIRQKKDPRKKDFNPTVLDFGSVRFHIARHFGFCFGVENAIEISYRAIDENPNNRIFLLSQMIHNPDVNNDLQSRGINFIMDTLGNQLIDWNEIKSNDIVIIPAFGTTLEILDLLKQKGVETKKYDTTCPFVTRVWKRADQLGKQNHTIIIHGKHNHEETRATYSYSKKNAPSLIIKDMDEAIVLSQFILGTRDISQFEETFKDKYSESFNPKKDLDRIGVINQTTMLATETQAISNFLKEVMQEKFGADNSKEYMADTRDTLCYATNENQDSTYGLLNTKADLAIVVGGYNSSNTSHLVELCEEKLPTYFICNSSEIISKSEIQHFNFQNKKLLSTENYIPQKEKIDIILTSGASCPDTIVEEVLNKLLSYFPSNKSTEEVLDQMESSIQ
jgi:4-hydroxy-3-methylbut-2-enyl diphosphate reductase